MYCLESLSEQGPLTKPNLKSTKGQISMQQRSTSALWVQKLNNILRRNSVRLWDRDPWKVPRWENNTTWGKDPELNVAVTRRASEQKHHKNLYHSCCFLNILPLQLSETLQCIEGISHTTGSFNGRNCQFWRSSSPPARHKPAPDEM